MTTTSEVPRRIDTLRWTPAERAIHDAVQVVEQAGAHPLLTDAVILLGQAQSKVADFVDGVFDARYGTGTKHRWNASASVWEFWYESWGGWCILRQTAAETSPPMTYEQGCLHIRQRPDIHVVRYDDTATEPRAEVRGA